jgi:type II secretory pathway component PulK
MPDIPPAPATAQNAKFTRRRGVVLVAVLVVVVLLALAGYHYADLMLAEYKACESSHRAMQAQKFADSGIHYAAALLSSPENYSTLLNGNPWNNQAAFQGIQIQGDGNLVGYFDIIAPPNIDDPSETSTWIYGVQDEGSKINLNALMKVDATGKTLYNMLMMLPNMTTTIAANIVAWMGGSYGISQGGVGDDTYMGLPQPYHCKNGPIDSIDELMLVQGITWDLLYGSDLNRNGIQEDGEIGPYGYLRGWSAFLTVHSREQNSDSNGNPYVYLNNTDLTQLYTMLQDGNVDPSLAKFIIMYRQYGPSNSKGSSQGLISTVVSMAGGGGGAQSSVVQGSVGSYDVQFTKSGGTQFTSIFQLCNAYVTISGPDPNNPKNTITTVYPSPVNDVGSQRSLLPPLFTVATLVQATEIPARINVNTAPMAVLTALPGLQISDVQKIMTRPDVSQGETFSEIYLTPTWLLTEAGLSLNTLQQLDPYVTTRSQVYRIQSVGYFDPAGKGPKIRLEAVIDTNNSSLGTRPRILAWRSLSELGPGWTPSTNSAPSATPATSP